MICMHQNDFGMKAQWNFFATGYVKSPSDDIGGALKTATTKASQRPLDKQILGPF